MAVTFRLFYQQAKVARAVADSMYQAWQWRTRVRIITAPLDRDLLKRRRQAARIKFLKSAGVCFPLLLVCAFAGQAQTVDDFLVKQRARVKSQLDQLAGKSIARPKLGCHITPANGEYLPGTSGITGWEQFTDGMIASGCTVLAIELDLGPYVNNDATSQSIRADYNTLAGPGGYIRTHYPGTVIRINPTFVLGHVLTCGVAVVADWTACVGVTTRAFLGGITAYRFIAANLQPEYFEVVHEPTTMASRFSPPENSTPAEWVTFVNTTSAEVKLGNPSTKVGATCWTLEIPAFSDALFPLASVDAAGLDIYFADCFPNPNNICPAASEVGKHTAAFAGAVAAGKQIFIEETSHMAFVPNGTFAIEQNSIFGCGWAGWERNRVNMDWLFAILYWGAAQGVTDTDYNGSTMFIYTTDLPTESGNCLALPYVAGFMAHLTNRTATSRYAAALMAGLPVSRHGGNFKYSGKLGWH